MMNYREKLDRDRNENLQRAKSLIDNHIGEGLKSLIQNDLQKKKFLRVLKTAIFNNENLLATDQHSLVAACFKIAEMGMMPDGKEAALIPYKGRVQAIPMVGGYIKKMLSLPNAVSVSTDIVHENDIFKFELTNNGQRVSFTPDYFSDRGAVKGVFACLHFEGGRVQAEVAGLAEIETAKAQSSSVKAGRPSPWNSHYSEMAKKFILKRLGKRINLFVEDPELAEYEEEEEEVLPSPLLIEEKKEEK